MKIINGENLVLGRLASYAAKEALKGEEVVVTNCEKVIITGNRKSIKDDFELKRTKIGSGQKGPKISRLSERIVKRAIRGMIPNHRQGRGKIAFKKIKCYDRIPDKYKNAEKSHIKTSGENKFIMVKELSK